MKLSSAATEALRSTLQMVEQQCGLAPDDPGLVELKRILLNRIAELEAVEAASEQSAREPHESAAGPAAILSSAVRRAGD
jgi:hypothetical protein